MTSTVSARTSAAARIHPLCACAVLGLIAACSRDPGDPPAEEKRAETKGATEDTEHAALDTEALDDRSMPTKAERGVIGPGNWRRARARVEGGELTDEQRADVDQLEAIGYATGSREALASGVTIHLREKVYPGLNLYTSGHAPEALLVDMDGKELHRWGRTFAEVFGNADPPKSRGSQWWCWMHLYENGDVLALFSGEGIAKLNARSEVLWAHRNRAHHDVAIADDGDIYVLTRKASVISRVHPTRPILEDFVTVMGPDGKTKRSFSLLEAFERSSFPDAWRSAMTHGDVFHTNALVLLDGCGCDKVAALAKGNLLLSLAEPDVLAVVDPKSEKVVWALEGEFATQHDSQIVGDGHLLLFDNEGLSMASRALELDPATGETVWQYRGDERNPLYSKRMGGVQRLPNGNTLVTESENGRVIEVTAAGEIVWEFHTPYHAGDEGEFIAAICRMARLRPDFPTDWIPSR